MKAAELDDLLRLAHELGEVVLVTPPTDTALMSTTAPRRWGFEVARLVDGQICVHAVDDGDLSSR